MKAAQSLESSLLVTTQYWLSHTLAVEGMLLLFFFRGCLRSVRNDRSTSRGGPLDSDRHLCLTLPGQTAEWFHKSLDRSYHASQVMTSFHVFSLEPQSSLKQSWPGLLSSCSCWRKVGLREIAIWGHKLVSVQAKRRAGSPGSISQHFAPFTSTASSLSCTI